MNNEIKMFRARAATGGYLDKLETLYGEMDRAYAAAASDNGFVCAGCEENCCLTRFYHHTYLEYFYFLSGFKGLSEEMQLRIRNLAAKYDQEMNAALARGEEIPFRHLCPLNDKGKCLLYAHRPMICRLHGIPHELNPPGGGRVYGEGCREFEHRCGGRLGSRLDRTPFYLRMAALERQLKEETGTTSKFKRTVARMLLDA